MTSPMILQHVREGVDVLERPRFRGPDRHRSVRETNAWSYALLDEEERRTVARLAVCAGPFDLELAAAVIGHAAIDGGDEHGTTTTLDLIDALAEASLVTVDASSPNPYRMLEMIGSFAIDQLDDAGERVSAEDRFAGHVVASVVEIMERGRDGGPPTSSTTSW